HSRHLHFSAVMARVSGNDAVVEISALDPKHRAPWRHCVFARLVARGRRSVLSHAAGHFAFCDSLAAHGLDRSMPNRPRWDFAPDISRLSKSRRHRRFFSRLPILDLLSNLDPARSARFRCWLSRNRKIPTRMLATPKQPRAVDLVTGSGRYRL